MNSKRLSELVKKRSKKLHFPELILKYKGNIKINKAPPPLPAKKKKKVNNEQVANVDIIVEIFNKYFSEIDSKLAKNIEMSSIGFKSYIQKYERVQYECDQTEELKEAFFFA